MIEQEDYYPIVRIIEFIEGIKEMSTIIYIRFRTKSRNCVLFLYSF